MKSILTLTLACAALPLAAQTVATSTLARRVAADACSPQAPLLVCIGMHVEPFGAIPSKLAVPENVPVPRQQASYRNPQWEQAHPGVDPRGTAPTAPVPVPQSDPPNAHKGSEPVTAAVATLQAVTSAEIAAQAKPPKRE